MGALLSLLLECSSDTPYVLNCPRREWGAGNPSRNCPLSLRSYYTVTHASWENPALDSDEACSCRVLNLIHLCVRPRAGLQAEGTALRPGLQPLPAPPPPPRPLPLRRAHTSLQGRQQPRLPGFLFGASIRGTSRMGIFVLFRQKGSLFYVFKRRCH